MYLMLYLQVYFILICRENIYRCVLQILHSVIDRKELYT